MSRTRIGVLGGTFDPFHNGHLSVAHSVRDSSLVDCVIVVPANDQWQKKAVATAQQRLEMARRGISVDAVSGTGDSMNHALSVSDVDILRGGPTYTIETLDDLSQLHPDADFRFIVGVDAAAGLPSWHRSDELRDRASFIVVTRPGTSPPQLNVQGYDLNLLQIQPVDVSSSMCREAIRNGAAVTDLVPLAVAAYIESEGLYWE